MTILLYDYCELEERASRHLKAWKVWHLVLYACAAIFGVVNYVFLQNTMELVDDNCVLYPRILEFRVVDLRDMNNVISDNGTTLLPDNSSTIDNIDKAQNATGLNSTKVTVKREAVDNVTTTTESSVSSGMDENVNINSGNGTHRLALDTSRTLFNAGGDCEFAQYMPVLSTVFAAVWLTMFTMCPGGGHARSGLQQPWRILMPALIFSLIMVGLTGHSFSTTNKGLHAFCEEFAEVTNSTTCSPVNDFLELGWNATWSFSSRVSATRAASAAMWASWACAAALLLARCLSAADFQVKRTGVYLTKDPQQKITPHLKKTRRPSHRSQNSSPNKRDNISVRSEPTATTELVTVSVEQGQESLPPSLMGTPMKTKNGDMIEMAIYPQEQK